MLVGVFSDTHDNLTQIRLALAEFERRNVEAILHAGDIVAPFAAQVIAQVDVPLHVVYGNSDGEREGVRRVLPQIAAGTVVVDLDKHLVALTHDVASLGTDLRTRADIIVTGHTHVPLIEHTDGKLWVNPGECCGWVKGRSTIAILDTDGPDAEIVELPLT